MNCFCFATVAGRFSAFTETAMKMCSYVVEEFCQKEMKLMRLEPLVNPLLDENDLVRLGFLLQKAVDAMRGVENSRAFHFPVEKRRYPVSFTVAYSAYYSLSLHSLRELSTPGIAFHSTPPFLRIDFRTVSKHCTRF